MKAAEFFNSGYSCSESIVRWGIEEGLVSQELLSTATAFSGGMGAGCLCGAIAGAQIIIGTLYGRENKFNNEVIARVKSKEFIEKFKEKHGATCCRVLTKGMEMATPERKAHCTNMINECENIIREILALKV